MATDNFNRADADPIGGNWSTSPGFGSLRLVSNTLAASATGDSCAYWNADSFANDQYSQIVASTLGTNTDWGPAVRCATGGASANCYLAACYSPGEALSKFVGGSFFNIAAITTSDVIVGDIIRIEAEGTTLRWIKNGSSQGSATDSSLSSGAAGVFVYESDARMDDWEGGDIGAAGATPKGVFGLPLHGPFAGPI